MDFNKYSNILTISVQFLLLFYKLRFQYRQKLLQEKQERDKAAQLAKAAEEKVKKDIEASKNSKKVTYEFTAEEEKSAIKKITEAAIKYDKNMPGTVQLSAFEAAGMEPVEFKEQLERAFEMKLSPGELGALIK